MANQVNDKAPNDEIYLNEDWKNYFYVNDRGRD